ncbi:MAG: hypothetical protein QOH06_1530 [Acidobacteriota bacterium]|jgi:hypothetical protein|nr:hypothetical protein [Acidobacteriota bacterium]
MNLPPASAVIGTIDAVPAATLLLPYFEVDIANQNGVDTMFSINNASNLAVLAHVTVWTDQSVPALDFAVYLTGYDVQTISLRDIFVSGNLPRTASAGQDSTDTISPQGPMSQDINFPSCSSLPYAPGAVSASFRSHLQAWFQGNQSPATGNCAGSKQPDTNILRGYVTVDTVNACNLFFPSDWAFYDQFVTDQNVLWGDYFYFNPDPVTGNIAQGDTLVHIEACPTCFAAGDHTFYGRYNGATAADAREPLPTTMAARYENGDLFGSGTDFLVWREANESDSAYNCNLQGPSSWYPLSFFQVLIFDDKETVRDAEECWWGEPDCTPTVMIPNAANRIDAASGLLAPFASGWMHLNLQQPETIPIYSDPYAQMWLTTVMEGSGRYGVGFSAIQLDNANQ